MKRITARIVCLIRGHRPVRYITGAEIVDGTILGGLRFRETSHNHGCQRCGLQPLPGCDRTPGPCTLRP